MPVPDWSKVEWHIYEAEDGRRRVMWRELSTGELRPGEKRVATVMGVCAKTIFRHLKNGVLPIYIQGRVNEAAQRQYERSAEDRGKNWYREWIAEILKRQRAITAT